MTEDVKPGAEVQGSRREILVGGAALAAMAATVGTTAPAQAQLATIKGPYRAQESGLVEFTGHGGAKGVAYFAKPAGFSADALAPPPPLLAPAMPGKLVVKVLSTKDLIVSFNTFGALNTA